LFLLRLRKVISILHISSCTFQLELGIPRTNTSGRSLSTYTHLVIYVLPLCIRNNKERGELKMRDLKTYLSVAPVVSTLWFGSLAGLLIEINRFFPDALIFPFFFILVIDMGGGEED
jgi:photosystem I subunit 9